MFHPVVKRNKSICSRKNPSPRLRSSFCGPESTSFGSFRLGDQGSAPFEGGASNDEEEELASNFLISLFGAMKHRKTVREEPVPLFELHLSRTTHRWLKVGVLADARQSHFNLKTVLFISNRCALSEALLKSLNLSNYLLLHISLKS